jgi:hypothetical protein
MRISRAFGLAALVAGLTLALVAPASGHILRNQRKISAGFLPSNPTPPYTAVTGRVTSTTSARCRSGSRVTVFKVAPGADTVVGSGITTQQGYFTIPAPNGQFADGAYYLTVKRKILVRNRFHRHTCPSLRTQTVTITNP